MYLDMLNDNQVKKLQEGFSKTFFDGADVKITDSYGTGAFTMFVDNEWYAVLGDFNITKYNSDLFVSYCSFMANIFKDEYITSSKEYLSQRIQEDSRNLMCYTGEINQSRLKDLNFHSEILLKLDEEYNSILNRNKTKAETF